MTEPTPPSLVIDSFRPADAPGIAQLFRAVYGDGYPIKTVYDPAALIEANAKASMISTVARTAPGEIIGHEAFFRSAPYAKLYEAGAGLVLPAYRKFGLMKQLLEYQFRVDVRRADIEEAMGEPVCNHVAMQKAIAVIELAEYALEVDLMPAEAYTQEQSARGRVSTLLSFRTIKPKPHLVYLPRVYRAELEYLYTNLRDERTFVWTENDLPREGHSVAQVDIFDFAHVARIAISSIGADFAEVALRLEDEARAQGVTIFQMWLPLASPSVSAAVKLLRTRGYFLGGVLPRWFDQDGLLMQKVSATPNWEGIVLFAERAKKIQEFVKQDWARTQVG